MQRDSFIPVDDIFSMSTEMKNGYQEKKKIAIHWIMQNIMLTFLPFLSRWNFNKRIYIYYTIFFQRNKNKNLKILRFFTDCACKFEVTKNL